MFDKSLNSFSKLGINLSSPPLGLVELISEIFVNSSIFSFVIS